MFIVSQIIQDEMQVTRLRQDLFLIDSQAVFRKMDASDVDDAKKKVIDSIAKINKTIFEFTKYLDDEKSVIEQKEAEEKEKEESKKEFGLSFDDFLNKKETDTKRKKAVEIQKSKANEYIRENLEADNVTG
jgi:mannitol-specific phosphotransferase system IIBC component